MYIVILDLSCWECWLNSLRECQWKYTCKASLRTVGTGAYRLPALRRLAKSEVIPSNNDRFLRKDTLQGFVHDEASAFFGGLAGNAGLFSTAREVARVYQMLLNGGEIDGRVI